MTSPLSLTSRTWFESINNFIPVPALASAIEPPSYVTLYPLSPAKTVSGIATQRTTAKNLLVFILSPDFVEELAQMAREPDRNDRSTLTQGRVPHTERHQTYCGRTNHEMA